jgi:hypothetical protein
MSNRTEPLTWAQDGLDVFGRRASRFEQVLATGAPKMEQAILKFSEFESNVEKETANGPVVRYERSLAKMGSFNILGSKEHRNYLVTHLLARRPTEQETDYSNAGSTVLVETYSNAIVGPTFVVKGADVRVFDINGKLHASFTYAMQTGNIDVLLTVVVRTVAKMYADQAGPAKGKAREFAVGLSYEEVLRIRDAAS